MIRFAKSIFAGEQGRTCRRPQATSAITRSDVVCHFWPSKAPSHPRADHHGRFPSRVCGVTLAQRRTRCGMPFVTMTFSCSFLCGVDIVCDFAGLPSTNRVLQAKFSWRPWRAVGCSRAASLHQRHSHLCATDAASFSQIGSRFAGQRTRHLSSLAQHSDPTVP